MPRCNPRRQSGDLPPVTRLDHWNAALRNLFHEAGVVGAAAKIGSCMIACWKGMVVLTPVIMYSPSARLMRSIGLRGWMPVVMSLAIIES